MISTGLKVRIVNSIRALDEDRWDALAGQHLVMSHRWQRVMEDTRTAYQPRYVLAEDDRGPLLGLVANTNETFGRGGWQEAALRRFSVVVSAPFSSQHRGLMMRSDTPSADVLPLLERLLRQLCWREQRLVAGVANVSSDEVDQWRSRGFVVRRQPVSMRLDLPLPASYERYLESLSTADRTELRRARRRGSEFDATFSHLPLRAADEHLFPMFAEVCNRNADGATDLPFTPALFSALEREMPGEVMIFSGSVAGQPAGYLLGLLEGHTLLIPLAGLRYALTRPSSMYFLLLDEVIQWSLRHGIQSIHAGLTNETQKKRHGFTPRSRWFCFRAYPGALNRAFTPFHSERDS